MFEAGLVNLDSKRILIFGGKTSASKTVDSVVELKVDSFKNCIFVKSSLLSLPSPQSFPDFQHFISNGNIFIKMGLQKIMKVS